MKSNAMNIGRDDAEFWPLHSFELPIIVSEIWHSFCNIRASKIRIFVNFDLDQHFQGHML